MPTCHRKRGRCCRPTLSAQQTHQVRCRPYWRMCWLIRPSSSSTRTLIEDILCAQQLRSCTFCFRVFEGWRGCQIVVNTSNELSVDALGPQIAHTGRFRFLQIIVAEKFLSQDFIKTQDFIDQPHTHTHQPRAQQHLPPPHQSKTPFNHRPTPRRVSCSLAARGVSVAAFCLVWCLIPSFLDTTLH